MTLADAQTNFLEAVKQVGFPVVVAGTLIWMGNNQIETASARFDKQQDFITKTLSDQLSKSTAAISAVNGTLAAVNQTLQINAEEQRQTRAVLQSINDKTP